MLLIGVVTLYETKELWHMESPNAVTWNATLNGTLTGFNMVPLLIVVAVIAIALSLIATFRGFG
ncbi:MAG TPA: hypothetical protein ENG74_03400 [Thermoplasmatales archaeon]|nr:hypothetical protein [Thermoplasmatales archaeon]